MSPARWVAVAGAVGSALVAGAIVFILVASEERRSSLFEESRLAPPRAGAGRDICPGAAKGTRCPESWVGDGFDGDATFPRRIQPPKVIHRVAPAFPEEARKRGLSGRVVLDVGIRRDGSVGGVCVRAPLPCGLDAAAEAAVKQWRFEKPLVDGRAADVVATIVIDLRDQ